VAVKSFAGPLVALLLCGFMSFDQDRRRALIVGNSDGIGLGLTRRLVDAGWAVAGLSRSASSFTAPGYEHRVVDVTDHDYRIVLADAVETLGGVEVCVYAAGVGDFFDSADLSAQTRALEVNLVGAARTIEVVVPAMVANGGGHIVGLSSIADATASVEAPAYAASKAGLSRYLLGLRGALRSHGVTVSTIRFGFVDTKMAKSSMKPMMMSVDKAVDVVVDCLRTRRAVVSYPRPISLLARATGPLVTARARR
jgi:short-subunit dehydrogenase